MAIVEITSALIVLVSLACAVGALFYGLEAGWEDLCAVDAELCAVRSEARASARATLEALPYVPHTFCAVVDVAWLEAGAAADARLAYGPAGGALVSASEGTALEGLEALIALQCEAVTMVARSIARPAPSASAASERTAPSAPSAPLATVEIAPSALRSARLVSRVATIRPLPLAPIAAEAPRKVRPALALVPRTAPSARPERLARRNARIRPASLRALRLEAPRASSRGMFRPERLEVAPSMHPLAPRAPRHSGIAPIAASEAPRDAWGRPERASLTASELLALRGGSLRPERAAS